MFPMKFYKKILLLSISFINFVVKIALAFIDLVKISEHQVGNCPLDILKSD